jgi:putative aminopeptidase FrvX
VWIRDAHRQPDQHDDKHIHPNNDRHPDHYSYPQSHDHGYCYLDADVHTFPASDIYKYANSNAFPDPNFNTHEYLHPDIDEHADIHPVQHPDSTDADRVPDSILTMTEILPFLKSLVSVSGLSAYEGPVARLIEEKWGPLVDEVHVSRLGSLHGLKRGSGKTPRPSILIATHMDAIGLVVQKIVDGFLYFAGIGGVDVRVLPGTPVLVHATGRGKLEELPGVICMPPAKLLSESTAKNEISMANLLVDTGLLPRDVSKRVRVGDVVSFNTEPVEMSGETLSGHSLDNRASVAALTLCLQELQSKTHLWDVWAAATVQEEVTLGGAATSAFQLQPALAIAVDTTFGKGPGASGWETFPMGKGVTIGIGPNIHPHLHTRFKEIAESLEIPHAVELIPKHSGTDAYAMQVAAQGIPTAVLEIPLRYMHTPVEMIAIKDAQRMGRLLAGFVAALEADFIEKIVWE